MAEQMRSCRKTACRWPAAASLSFRYATQEVWLLDLAAEPDPSLYDLCPHHADALTVPKGWTRVDQRSSADAPVEPAASDRVAEPASARHSAPPMALTGEGQASRYEALSRDLPRLAAEWANGNGSWAAETPLTHAPPVRPSVDDALAEALTGQVADVPGQLAIPVEEREPADHAVVVSIEMARRPS